MLRVFGKSLSIDERQTLRKILHLAQIDENTFQIIDLADEDIVFSHGEDQVLVVGKDATRKLIKHLIGLGFFSNATFLGKDLVDRDNKFFFYTIPEVQVFMQSQENKDFVWTKIVQVKEHMDQFMPFNDPLDFDTSGGFNNGETSDAIETKTETVNVKPEEVATEEKEIATDGGEVDEDGFELNVETIDIIKAVIDQVNFNDQNLGKSLARYDKFSFTSNGNTLNVYPTSRIPSSDQHGITLKDLLVVLKSAMLFGSESVVMRKNGSGGNT